ncbi:MAG: hypothetical protein K6G24_05885 [Lachnospiraceae bacterium]|nr:hypothetical protein [Lachnospiraceae bacterium]
MGVLIVESFGTGIVIKATVDHTDYNGTCQIELVHVYDWYDVHMINSANCTISNGCLCAEMPETLEKGLYLLCSIVINDNEEVLGKREKEGFSVLTAFYLGDDLDVSQQVLHDSYFELLDHREEVFSDIKGDIEGGTTLFDCYAFVKNMNAVASIQYGDIEVIPFNEYKALSESKMIDAFFTGKGIPFDYSSNLKTGYGAFIYMKNVLSDEKGEFAKKFIQERAGIVANLFSLSNHDNCQIISTVIHNLATNVFSININAPIYQGNLLRLADQGFAIREKYLYLLENDTNLNVYIKLFNKAEAETDALATYFRFWTLLEVMAETNGIIGQNMVEWDGTPIFSKKGKTLKIENNLDAVFELVRIKYSSNNSRDFIKMPSITNVKEFLSVCYQRRCCYAHRGVCDAYTNRKINCDSEVKKRCKASMVTKRGKINDQVLTRLELLVREMIYKIIDEQILVQ